MIFNYLRVSTILQNSDRQLHNVPCDRDYIDKISGKDMNRHQFKLMMDNLREGDIVNVHSLDRVGRNTADILELVKQIKEKGCSIKFHKENLTFDGTKSDLYSELLLTVLAAFSQFERSIILERQREGIAIAKAKGVYKGRKAKLSSEQIKLMKADFHAGIAKTKIAEKYGVTRSYVYQLVKQETKDEIKKEDVSLDVIGKHYKKGKITVYDIIDEKIVTITTENYKKEKEIRYLTVSSNKYKEMRP